MPLPAMTEAQIEEGYKKADADLRLHMDQAGVSRHAVAVLANAGFSSTRMYRCFASSAENLPSKAKLMGLDPDSDLMAHAEVAKLQMVWLTANSIQVAEETDKAEKRVLGINRQIKSTEYSNMRQCYEKKVGKQRDREFPGTSILERLDLDVEEGEWRAPKLTEVTSREEQNPYFFTLPHGGRALWRPYGR